MKYYIPTNSLNIDNILSTEFISPSCFYPKRTFGFQNFEDIPYEIPEDSLCLFSEIPSFDLNNTNEIEQYPIVIQFDDDEQLEGCSYDVVFQNDKYKIISCRDSLYLTPWNTVILYFTENAYISAKLIIDSSRNCKLGAKYVWKKAIPTVPLTELVSQIPFNPPAPLKNFDSEINTIKGAAWGYVLGCKKTLPKNSALLLSLSNKMRNIISNTISNSGNCTPSFYNQLLSFDTQYRAIADQQAILHWDAECPEENKLILQRYNVLKEAMSKFFSANNYALTPEIPPANCEKSFWIAYREKLAAYTESFIIKQKPVLRIELDSLSFSDRSLSIKGCSIVNNLLAMILDGTLNKESLRISRLEVVKKVLLTISSIYKQEKGDDYWKTSSERIYINNLFKNIQDYAPFDINSIDNLELKSTAAFLLKGEDFDALIRYLQDNEFSDFTLVLTLWGASEGYALLNKSLFSSYMSPKLVSSINDLIGLKKHEDTFPILDNPTFTFPKSSISTKSESSNPSLNADIYSILKTVKNGKKSLSKEVIENIVILYKECEYKTNDVFYSKLNNISGVGKGTYKKIKEVLGSTDSSLTDNNSLFNTSFEPTSSQSLRFVSDKDLGLVISEMGFQDKSTEDYILNAICYIQKHHVKTGEIDDQACIKHLKRLLFSPKYSNHFEKNATNEAIVERLINILKLRYRG